MKKVLFIILLSINIYLPIKAQNFQGGNDDGFSVSGQTGIDVSALKYYAYIKNVSSGNADGYYGIGKEILILIEFDRNVDVSGGTPLIILETGTTNRPAYYISGSGTKTLTFSYVVVEGDSTVDLSYLSNQIELSGAQITDVFGNNAVLDLPASGTIGSLSYNKNINIDGIKPVGTLDLAVGQADTTNSSPVNYVLSFSEPISGLNINDFSLSGTAGANNISIIGSGTEYFVSVSGMTNDGTIILGHLTTSVQDTAGNWNAATIIIKNTVYYDVSAPVAQINVANTQADPTNSSPVNFTITFSEAVLGFTSSDIQLSGTANPSTLVLTGSGSTYNAEVSGMTSDGTVIINIPEKICSDSVGNLNLTTLIVKNQINYDVSRPGIEIIRETGQSNPSNDTVIYFRAIFTEQLNNFVPSNVKLSGTAGANSLNLRGGPDVYTMEVSGMSSDGSVIVSIPENVLADAAGNMNTASVNTDNQACLPYPS
ncbi:MAG: Ig-like domain-containing protein [Bacteroidales bacterium]|nr:Ig-like domain-containing protein [Bacteroidales bacterium]